MYSGMLIPSTIIIALFCFLSSAPKTIPLVQEIFVEFSSCKQSIETLRNDLIILENSISTIGECEEKGFKANDVTHAERLERRSNSVSNEVDEVAPAKSDPFNSNHSMATTMSGFRDGLSNPENYSGDTSIDHTLSLSAHQNMSIIQVKV